ncbi:MAG: LamG domain-containing protein [Actinomycetota bacterium]|nr:LamG domain-containing protein [Actinomycetota bacterium]
MESLTGSPATTTRRHRKPHPGKKLNRHVLLVAITAVVATGLQATSSAATTTVARWHMDETSGNVMWDSSGHGNDGALHKVRLGRWSPKGMAYGFNGQSSYVKVPDNASLNPRSASVSVILHVKFGTAPSSHNDYDLFRKGRARNRGDYKVEILDTGKASCVFRGSAGAARISRGPSLADGSWHKIRCTKSARSIKLVVDGRAYSKYGTVGWIANCSKVVIGAKPGADYYQGRIDEVHVAMG